MAEPARWMRLAAGLMMIASPFLPQADGSTPSRILRELAPSMLPVERLGYRAWLFLPLVAGALLIGASRRGKGSGPALRAATLGLLFVSAFGLSTLGSLLLTNPGGGPQAPVGSFPLALLLFMLPLLLAGVALARIVGGDFTRSTGGYARCSLGLLVALNGLHLLDLGWPLLSLWAGHAPPARLLPGAWAAPAGGLIAAAAELAARFRPRAAVDSAPASG